MNFRFVFFPDEDPASEAARRFGAAQNGSSPPYEIRDGGMVRRAGAEGDRLIPVANFVARIDREVLFDDGETTLRHLGITAEFRGNRSRFTVPAAEFRRMGWVLDHLGAQAIVYPGQQQHARAAIQALSEEVAREERFTHTGWRKIDGNWVYLDRLGAIGASGRVGGIGMTLAERLRGYELRLPSDAEAERHAVEATLSIIDLAPERISVPLLAAIFRAVVGEADFSLYLTGPTGVFKSALAALAQQHFGAGMDGTRLPANFGSTPNSLEYVAYHAKDAVLVVDDFAPSGTAADRELEAVAERLFRAAGNRQGRGRLRSKGGLEAVRFPRALVLATGEDVPSGHSIRARLVIVDIAQGDVAIEKLSGAQQCARCGLFAQTTAGFVKFLAPRLEDTRERFETRTAELRRRRFETTPHARTAAAVAELEAAWEIFLDYGAGSGALPVDRASELRARGAHALDDLAYRQAQYQDAADPALRFIALLGAALSQGLAHVADRDGGIPVDAARWGWRQDQRGWTAPGCRIGWIDRADLYLDSAASYSVAQTLAASQPIVVGEQGIRMRLHQRRLLASVDERRETLKIRRTLEGRQREVLHLDRRAFP